ncbi:MAG: hypothetical protein ACKVOI_14940 [Dongiaceae bacterium]
MRTLQRTTPDDVLWQVPGVKLFSGPRRTGQVPSILGRITKRDSGDIHLGDGTTLESSDDDIIGALGKVDYQFAEFHRIEARYLRLDNTAEEPNNGQSAGGRDSVERDYRGRNLAAIPETAPAIEPPPPAVAPGTVPEMTEAEEPEPPTTAISVVMLFSSKARPTSE